VSYLILNGLCDAGILIAITTSAIKTIKQVEEMNILIIDSDKEIVDELTDMLDSPNYTVAIAAGTDNALAMSKQIFFEVVLMELILEGSETYHIIPELKLYNPGVSIITMTWNSTPELERNTRESGISFYLGKPIVKDQLMQIIDQITVFYSNFGEWKKVPPF